MRYLLDFGAVLIAALALLSQHTNLDWWVTAPAVLYLAVMAAVFLFGPAVRVSRWLVSKARRFRLARLTQHQLADAINEFTRLLGRDYADTVLNLLKETAPWEQLKNYPQLHDFEHVQTLNRWLSTLASRTAEFRRADFENLCQDLSVLVHQYNRHCSERHRVLQEAIIAGKIVEPQLRYLKQQWNVRREGHVQFVKRCTELSVQINQGLGKQLCVEFNEPLGTLE